MRRGQEAARRFHEEPERSSDFLCLADLEDFLFCLRKNDEIWNSCAENVFMMFCFTGSTCVE